MKKYLVLALAFLFQLSTMAQKVVELTENTPVTENDLEYGFFITNEKNKSVKGEDYDRFELELYVNNKSSCIKIFPFKTNNLGQIDDNASYILADFTVQNATGKRLTSKSGKVEAQPWYTMVKANNQATVTQGMVGYAIKIGQSLTKKIIVIVPKGERPKINCKMSYIPQLL
jgi:hypothetical protein